jgi:hypothetical protein
VLLRKSLITWPVKKTRTNLQRIQGARRVTTNRLPTETTTYRIWLPGWTGAWYFCTPSMDCHKVLYFLFHIFV